MSAIEAGCPCGATKLRISGEPFAQFYCHCADCRAVFGAGYVPEAIFATDSVKLSGPTISFAMKTTPRISCAKCGTRLYADLGDVLGVSGALLPNFAPELHINCAEAIAPVRDGLPHYATKPAAFGGDDKLVDW